MNAIAILREAAQESRNSARTWLVAAEAAPPGSKFWHYAINMAGSALDWAQEMERAANKLEAKG